MLLTFPRLRFSIPSHFLLLLAFLWPPAAAQEARVAQARAAALDFARADYVALYGRGAKALREAVSEDAFVAKFAGVLDSLGTCQPPKGEPAPQGETYVFRLECAKQTVGIRITLDAEGGLLGIFLAPPPPVRSAEPNLAVVTGRFKLPARLTLPTKGKAPFPCVVLVHGSGPQDMDESIVGNKPFRDLADGLALRGVASLRYDKRTLVYGPRSDLKTLDDETTHDAVSAARLCASQPNIDPSRVFVLGHSIGGYAAPRIAREAGPAVRGLIVLAGSSRPLGDVIDEQIAYLEGPPQQAAAIKKMIPDSWWKDAEGYDPAQLAASLGVPFLFLQGKRDYQVTMVDFARWKRAFAKSRRAKFKTYSKLNHLFMEGKGKPGPAEYETPGVVAPRVIKDIANWVRSFKRHSMFK